MESRIALVSLLSITLWGIVISTKNRDQCSTDLVNPCYETLQSIKKGHKLSEIRESLIEQVANLRECRKYNYYGVPYVNTPSQDYYKPVAGLYGYKPYVNPGNNFYNTGYQPGYEPGYKPGYKPGYSNQPTYCRYGVCREIGLLRSADQLAGNDIPTETPQNIVQTLPSEQSDYNIQSPLGIPIAITLLVYPYPNKVQNNNGPQHTTKIPSNQNQDNFEEFGESEGYSIVDYLLPDENDYLSEYEPEWNIFDEAMINEYFLLTGLGELDDVEGILLSRNDSVSVDSTQLLEQCSNIHATSYPQLLATIRAMKGSLNRKN
ncbi:uncharacterized protein LOC141858099 [Brevipalpus obovatus]|uniref:uncharacterized protein LOC141858099 n=1 Tax=Brevipalpus obovatus TaxID=246614 RepID=UPI003D9DBCAB